MIEGSTFKVWLGIPGSGKSLSMVEEAILPHLLAGEEVWCNFWLNWSSNNLHYFTNIEDVLNLRNCVVIFDEIGQVLEARNWSEESGTIRRFFQLHRHHHVDIYGTTQEISLIAKSALIVVDEFVLCDRVMKENWIKNLMRFIGMKRIVILTEKMSYSELKKMAQGQNQNQEYQGEWENGNIEIGKENLKRNWYKPKNLLHEELSQNKIEIYHKHCEKCAGRQGQKINLLTDPETLKEEYCPKHTEELLIIKKSGIYDSDYDISEKKNYHHTYSPIVKCDCGFSHSYKGEKTIEELAQLKKLNELSAEKKSELSTTTTPSGINLF